MNYQKGQTVSHDRDDHARRRDKQAERRERERERENAARENHFIPIGKYVDLHVGTNYAGYRVRSRSNISKEEEDTHYWVTSTNRFMLSTSSSSVLLKSSGRYTYQTRPPDPMSYPGFVSHFTGSLSDYHCIWFICYIWSTTQYSLCPSLKMAELGAVAKG